MLTRFALLALCFFGACRCATGEVQPLQPGQLRFTPERVAFAPTWVSQTSAASVEVLNTQGATISAELSIAAPFTVEPTRLTLARGEATTITLTFTPSTSGLATGVLKVDNLELPVEGEGLEVPACTTQNVCASAQFDFERAQCLESPRADGVSCETTCVVGGCAAGVCTGALKSCDDGDLCTVDACAEGTGCTHTEQSCPAPTNPCKAAKCDSTSGCGEEDVPDGTLCSNDDCTASTVDVCLAGRCVARPRPDQGRCANRWVPTTIPVRHSHALTFDSARSQAVVFGGVGTGGQLRGDTWVWDGQTWRERLPIASPPARARAAMIFDEARRRAVLFGGEPSDPDTWEWDGLTWVRRATTSAPSPRSGHAMAWDAVRRRTVLYGGSGTTTFGDTWEWDGARWLLRAPARSPGPRLGHALAWDPVRQRVVLFGGGFGGALNDTWEWDGTNWLERTPAHQPPARLGAALAWNGVTNRLVLFGGSSGALDSLSDHWEWDGTDWIERSFSSGVRPIDAAPMVWNPAEQRVLFFGGGARWGARNDTWTFDGTAWAVLETPAQLRRREAALTWDPVRGRALLFGGAIALDHGPRLEKDDTWEWAASVWLNPNPATRPDERSRHALSGAATGVLLFGGAAYGTALDDTWLWDGARWDRRTSPTSPAARSLHALSWDSVRQRVVLFGGNDTLSDTWEWDGVEWLERLPSTSPPGRDSHALAFDRTRQRTVLFGGKRYDVHLGDTWEWDGASWTQRALAVAPSPRSEHAMAYDTTRGRTVLFGGNTASRPNAETWEWDGTTWSQRQPTTSPPAGPAWMFFDESTEKVTLFDGNDIWLFLP